MENSVKVTTCKNDSREIIGVSSNNSDFGYIRVEENGGISFGAGGWLNSNTKSALIKGKVKDLETFVEKNNVTLGYELKGKIVVLEQTIPFYDGQIAKLAGANGEVLYSVQNGKKLPIYRQTEFTMDMSREDMLVKHDNVLSTASRKITPNEIVIK